MGIEYDPAKDADNVAKHGVSFAQYAGFDAEPLIIVDDRADYGETRFRAFGRIEGIGHATPRSVKTNAPDQFPSRAREGDAAP